MGLGKVMQGVRQDGGGNIAVQISGDDNSVTIACAGVSLHLQAKHANPRPVRTDLDLLRPETRLLDLVGRGGEMASLRRWLVDPRPVSARGVIGPGGSGKTRLAIELCAWAAEEAGWRAGFLHSGDLHAFIAAQRTAPWPTDRPLLVIVDYAARRARDLNGWLLSLARRPESERPRLRLLLLERHASLDGGWWAETLRLEGSDDSLYDCFDPPEPIPLTAIAETEQRRALLSGVMVAACQRVGKRVIGPPAPGADPQFDRRLSESHAAAEPLYLMMAGLFAVHHGQETLLSLGRLDLALELACWERDRLKALARERGVNERLIPHLVACATLCRGIARRDLPALIEAERAALGCESGVARDALTAVLDDVLPRTDGPDGVRLGGLEPDLIGETFTLLVLATNPDFDPASQTALIDRCRDRAPKGTAQSLILTIQDLARPVAELREAGATSRRLESRLLPNWLGEGNPALGWFDHLVTETDDLAILPMILTQLPEQTLILRERAALVTERIVDVVRELVNCESGDEWRSLLAGAMNDLANRWSQLGRREEALNAASEATELNRQLTAERPDAFRHGLAMSLNTLANRLSELGRMEEALNTATEAAELYRQLAAERQDTFRHGLAMSLNNLATIHSELGRREEALKVATEAAELYKQLATERPDAFLHHLAMSFCNLARSFSELGYREVALDAATEATELYRQLAAERPDAFRHDLANSLNNLTTFLSELGRREEACNAATEAVDIQRALAAERPNAFLHDLAVSLNNLAAILSELGRWEEALNAVNEATELYRQLAAARPDAFRHYVAMSLNNLAAILGELGRKEEALNAAKEGTELYRQLATERPDAFRHKLAGSLSNLAAIFNKLSHWEAALTAANEATELYQQLATERPDAFRHNLATSLTVLALSRAAQGERNKALATIVEAVTTLRDRFLALPHAFASQMAAMIREYVKMCNAAEQEPDMALLAPLLAVFQAMNQQSPNPDGHEEDTP